MKTDEVCDRPLETFGAATLGVSHAQFDTTSKFTCANDTPYMDYLPLIEEKDKIRKL